MILAGIICPVVFNIIFQQISNFNIPIISSQVTRFLEDLKLSIENGMSSIISDEKFQELIKNIDGHSNFSKVRLCVYDLILNMKSNALTKKIGQDLRDLMVQLNDEFENQGIMDEPTRELLRKKRLIKFYVEILYFTSPNRKTFLSKLRNSGLMSNDNVQEK